jgi:Flp pilus assembly pilin Flp
MLKHPWERWRQRWLAQGGATAVEYAILAAFLAVAAIVGAQLLEAPMANQYASACEELEENCISDSDYVPPNTDPPPTATPTEEPTEIPTDPGGTCRAGWELHKNGKTCIRPKK